MRIVYDIHTPMTVSGGGKAYSNRPGIMGFGHLQLDLMLTEDCADNHPDLPPAMFGEEETIHIQGDSKYIKRMFQDALEVIEHAEKYSLDKFGELRPTGCPDGCADIDQFHGNHEITCPRHTNYEYFQKERENAGNNSQ